MSYTKFPSLPYFYGGTLNHYVFTRQAWATYDEDETLLDGIQSCRGKERDMMWSSIAVDLCFFAVHKATFNVLSATALKFGLVQAPTAPPPDPMRTKLEVLFFEHQLRELVAKEERERGTNALAHPSSSIVELRRVLAANQERYAKELAEKKEREKRVAAGEVVDQGDQVSATQFLGSWGLSVASNVATNLALYPFSLVNCWLMAQEEDIGWFSAAKLLWEAQKNMGKSLYDGLLPHLLYSSLHSLMIVPPMKYCKKLFHIPPEHRLRSYILRIGLLGQMHLLDEFSETEPEEDPIQKKRELVLAFRSLMKNSFSYLVSNWAVGFGLFPLLTVRNKLAAQGASFLCPWRYSGFFSAVNGIYRSEGPGGFYRGIGGHAIRLGPQLVSMGCLYVAVSLLLEFLFDEDDEEVSYYDELDSEYDIYSSGHALGDSFDTPAAIEEDSWAATEDISVDVEDEIDEDEDNEEDEDAEEADEFVEAQAEEDDVDVSQYDEEDDEEEDEELE